VAVRGKLKRKVIYPGANDGWAAKQFESRDDRRAGDVCRSGRICSDVMHSESLCHLFRGRFAIRMLRASMPLLYVCNGSAGVLLQQAKQKPSTASKYNCN
jgi:hypothetical protein